MWEAWAKRVGELSLCRNETTSSCAFSRARSASICALPSAARFFMSSGPAGSGGGEGRRSGNAAGSLGFRPIRRLSACRATASALSMSPAWSRTRRSRTSVGEQVVAGHDALLEEIPHLAQVILEGRHALRHDPPLGLERHDPQVRRQAFELARPDLGLPRVAAAPSRSFEPASADARRPPSQSK